MERPGKRAALAAGLTLAILAAVGVLTAVLVPRVLFLRREAAEGRTMANLTAIRSALSFYARDHDGRFPMELDDPELVRRLSSSGVSSVAARSVGDRRLPEVDLAHLGHPPTSDYEIRNFIGGDGKVDPTRLEDSGRWLYDRRTGAVIVDCTHSPAAAAYLGGPIYSW